MVDPLRHPDLARVGRRMRDEYDAVLDAEQHAAAQVAQRRRTLRDLLLDGEDGAATAVVTTTDGAIHRGLVAGVGADHVLLDDAGAQRAVTLEAIVSVELR